MILAPSRWSSIPPGGGVGWSQPLGRPARRQCQIHRRLSLAPQPDEALGAQLVDQFKRRTTYGIISEMSGSNHNMPSDMR